MGRFLSVISLATLFALSNVSGQEAAAVKSSLVAKSHYQFTLFENQSTFTKIFYSEEEFESAKNSRSIECLRIKYLSDGFKVAGFIVKPRDTQNKRYPVIIYNRGGLLDIRKIDTPQILDFYGLASNGFVVLASQLRGNDGGEGREECGGADVNDVTNLLSLAASLPYVDGKIFSFTGSRAVG